MSSRGNYAVVLLKSFGREGGSYVSIPYLWSVSDYSKWEIKHLGVGYTIKRVSAPISFAAISAIVC